MRNGLQVRWFWYALVAVLFCAQSATAALTPQVTTNQIRDFTRITFNWPQKVRFKVSSIDSGVVLTFNQPASINLQKISSGLGNRLKNSSISDDGTTITLNFDQNYRVRHFISGNANGIDILGAKTSTKKAETKPKETPKAKAETPKPVPEPKTEPKTEPKKEVKKKKAEPKKAEKPTEKTQPAKEKAEKPVEEKTEEVVVAANDTVEEAPKAEEKPAPKTEASKDEVKETPKEAEGDKFSEFVEDEPETATAEETTAETTEPEEDVAAEEAPAAEDMIDDEAVEVVEVIETGAPEETPAEETQEAAEEEKADDDKFNDFVEEAPIRAEKPVETVTEVIADESIDEEPAIEIPTTPVAETDTPKDDRPFIVTAHSLPTGTEIRFPWLKRVAASVFFRNETLWIVFNEEKKLNLELLQSILPASVIEITQVERKGYTILRMETDGSVYAKVARPNNTVQWWVTLSNYRQIPVKPISLALRSKARIPNIYSPVLEYADPFTLTDPVIGDEMIITPMYNVGEGVYPTRSFVEFDLLESAQGLAIVKKSDLAKVQRLRNGIRLTARNGISLSADLPELALEELESLKSEYATWFPYERWKVNPEQFLETRQEIERKIQGASRIRANSLRLKLAQLYLSEGMGYETLGVLNIIESSDPGFFKERKLEAMRGAANFLINRFAEATESFKAEELKRSEEKQVWMDALEIFQRERPRFDYLDYYKTYIQKYPPKMREKLAVLAADNYINRKSYGRALKTFDTLSETGIDPRLMYYVDYLLGKISAETQKVDAAIAMWKPLVEQNENRFIRARAQFALTTLEYNNARIDIEEAIRRLDQLRIVWRGDGLELGLLNYLGQLYIDNGDYLEGLRAWRELATQFPTHEITTAVTREMAKTFSYLFADNGADKLEPLEALSIFFEFRELTPIGEAGDVMVQNLADRLAGVDLLDRAAALLEHQIKFRQEKDVRSKLGAQLALIRLLNKQPQMALDTLELTNYGQNPYELKRKRTQLAAMALSEVGQPARAIEMLSNDLTRDADVLRLNIYWKMRDWENVIASSESLLSSRPDMTRPLNEEETQYLLQLAISYMFRRDTIQLEYLRNYFAQQVTDGPAKDIFMFVTDTGGAINPNQFEEVNQQISRIENFMQIYRNRINEVGLSSALN